MRIIGAERLLFMRLINRRYKMLQDKIFKAAQRIIDNPWFLGCFMGATFAYIIYRGI